MADDIVTRLRANWFRPSRLVQDEAADEIVRLRADLQEAYDACRYALADSPRWRENAATVVKTWEARRG